MSSPVVRFVFWAVVGAAPGLVFGRPTVEYQYGFVGDEPNVYVDEERVRRTDPPIPPEFIRVDVVVRLAGGTVYEARGPEADVRERGAVWQAGIWAATALAGGLTAGGVWLWFRAKLGTQLLFSLPLFSFLALFGVGTVAEFAHGGLPQPSAVGGFNEMLLLPLILIAVTVPVIYLTAAAELLAGRTSAAAWAVRGVCRLIVGAYFLAGLLGLVLVAVVRLLFILMK